MNATLHHEIPVCSTLLIILAVFVAATAGKVIDTLIIRADDWLTERAYQRDYDANRTRAGVDIGRGVDRNSDHNRVDSAANGFAEKF